MTESSKLATDNIVILNGNAMSSEVPKFEKECLESKCTEEAKDRKECLKSEYTEESKYETES